VIQPYDLRCEYLPSPVLGLDVIPRFSWKLQGNGKKQSRFRIIVSNKFEDILLGQGNVWDYSADSEENINIEYSGKELQRYTGYYWRVKVWDENGDESEWSEPAYFEVGPLGDWRAKWITMKNPRTFKDPAHKNELYHAIYLRKEFVIKRNVKKARVYVSGLGVYELRINGKKVGDSVLDPAQTDYLKVALYSTYDITPFLNHGKNAVGVILGNGRHIKDYGYDKPKLFFQCLIEYENGEIDFVLSDESWKATHGPLKENSFFYGEHYDATEEERINGWDLPDFNDGEWGFVEVVDGPPLKAQLMPPIRACHTFKPQKMWSPRSGIYVFDFGQNISGWVRFRVSGPRGTIVKVRYGEILNRDGTVNTKNLRAARSIDEYTLKGGGTEVYEPRFTYHGFRYAEIEGYPGIPSPEDIEAVFVHTDVEKSGDFICSNEIFNKIHQCVVYSQLANLMGIPTDCPQRDERMGWLGDAQLTAEEAIFNFNMAAFYSKYLMDIKLSQREDGSLSDVVPPYWKRYPADPAWATAYATLLWYMYFFYGDKRVLEEHYESLKKYIDFLEKNSRDLILEDVGQHGDWCPPGDRFPKRTPITLTSTWYFYHDVLILSKIAKVLGNEEEHLKYSKLAEEIREAFNSKFLRKAIDHEGKERWYYEGLRLSSKDRMPTSQTANVLPLWLEMAPPAVKEKVFETLVNLVEIDSDAHFDTGVVGTRYILEVLSDNGRIDLAFKMLGQEDYPSFGYMIRHGATTLWERWEKLENKGMNSHNHVMFGSVDTWFYKYLLGIQPKKEKWKEIHLKPYFSREITFAKGWITTPRGTLKVAWEREGKRIRVHLEVPVSTLVTFFVPSLCSVVEPDDLSEKKVILFEAGVHTLSLEEVQGGND